MYSTTLLHCTLGRYSRFWLHSSITCRSVFKSVLTTLLSYLFLATDDNLVKYPEHFTKLTDLESVLPPLSVDLTNGERATVATHLRNLIT